MTTAGVITLRRVYFSCRQCREGGHPADEHFGVDGGYTRGAKRLICLAGASWGYEQAGDRLNELTGLKASENTVRAITQGEGVKMAEWQRESSDAKKPFVEADGRIEFQTDGTMVNTYDGWREARVGLFSKREDGDPCKPEDWGKRTIPKPHVRIAFAAIENSSRFALRWGRWATRLGIRDTSAIDVLADGGTWIWNEADTHFAGHDGCLDVYHAIQHIDAASKGLFGDGTDESSDWCERTTMSMLDEGYLGVVRSLHAASDVVPKTRWREHAASLDGYFSSHEQHMAYRERLASGRPIGSGQIEGACKNLIGRRLKQTGARWKIRRVNRMMSVCSILYGSQWTAYWNNSA
jgi:hypothetical protein